jgi:drug/metabolite transporter (DMT)-like permease
LENRAPDQSAEPIATRPTAQVVGFFSLATAAAIAAVFIWGGSPLVTKIATRSTDEFTLALLRTIASVPFALVVIVAMRLRLPWRGRDTFDTLGVAVTGLIGFPVLFTLGVAHTTAGHAAVASAATPVFAGLMVAAINRRWPAKSWWLGISVAFFGAIVLIWESIGIQSVGASWQGDLLVMGGAFSAALSFQFGARLTPRYGAPAVTMWSVIIAGILLLPVLWFYAEPEEILQVAPAGWAAIAYLAAGSSIIAYMAWFYALSRGGIARISMWHFALPVVGIAAAAIFLGEPLTPLLLIATVVILLGVGLVQCR